MKKALLSQRNENMKDLRIRHMTSQSNNFNSIYKLPYSRKPDFSLKQSMAAKKPFDTRRLTSRTIDDNINIVDQLEMSAPPGKNPIFESTGQNLMKHRKQNSMIISSGLDRIQKLPVKIEVNLNNNIFPVKLDAFERTVSRNELFHSDEIGIGSTHEIHN
jgi:hypothetical protein